MQEPRPSPSFPVWKLAALLVATATLYQFVWLYRTANVLRSERGLALTPWHWSLIPLLGPLAAVPAYRLASYLKDWQVEEQRRIGHLAEPVLVALLVVVAYLPLYLLFVEPGLIVTVGVAAALLLAVPIVAMQGQLNRNVADRESAARSGTYSNAQLATLAVGTCFALPLYVYSFTDVFEMRGSTQLDAGSVVRVDDSYFQVRAPNTSWTRVNPGYYSPDSALEFVGAGSETFAIVYEASGTTLDSMMAYRVDAVMDDYRNVSCVKRKSFVEGTLLVEGVVECTGRSPIDGHYVLFARTLVQNGDGVEMIVGTSSFDKTALDESLVDLRAMARGLEFAE